MNEGSRQPTIDNHQPPTDAGVATVVSLQELVEQAQHDGPIWSLNSEQFNINLLRFGAGDGVPEHTNNDVDVVGVVVEGEGILTVEAIEYHLCPGQMFLIPRGAHRAIRCTSDRLAYLSCHRRRTGLMPT